MNIEIIIELVTVIVTFILGVLSKKSKFINNSFIPLQNLLVGIIAFVIYYIITKDFNTSLLAVGLFTGGTYDLIKNLNKMLNENNTNAIK